MTSSANTKIYSAYDFVVAQDGYDVSVLESDPSGRERPSRQIITGTAGTLVVVDLRDEEKTLPSVADGHVWNVQVKTVKGTSGTATNVVILY